MLGGRRATSRLAKRSGALQMGMGAIMVVVGALMIGNYDIKFENTIAATRPPSWSIPTKGLEAQSSVHKQLAALKGGHTSALGNAVAGDQARSFRGRLAEARGGHRERLRESLLHLPVLGRAPEFVDTQRWFNTPGGRPLKLSSLRGKVVLVDFWTYSCINCIRTLPYVKAWYATYHSQGLEVIGVHTPEFAFEHVASNVQRPRSTTTASTTPWCRTTTARPSTPTTTNTGRPSTSSMRTATFASRTSARANTPQRNA